VMSAESLHELHYRLREDKSRHDRPFSPDMVDFGALMHKPYAEDHEIEQSLRHWCKTRQPCQFGSIAASQGQIYFCILRERDLGDGDEAIAEKIAAAKRHWKQRAVTDRQNPPHSFLLVFASPHVMLAAPDDNLRRFSNHLLALSGWEPQRRARRGANPISSDYLYLKNPTTDVYYGFQFNVDFFAAAGDGRWWHDHRFPGSIAFTANAVGHMKSFMDWYSEPGRDHGAWALTQAMMTIARSHRTKPDKEDGRAHVPEGRSEEGRATWLLNLSPEGRPIVGRLACPLKTVPAQLKGKDWTKYEGLLHTDHTVREEFFDERGEPPTTLKPHLMDFTYLYDKSQEEFINFTAGKPITEDEVFADIGSPEIWTHRAGEYRKMPRTPEQTADVAQLLHACYQWGPIEA
jgi:hypothetical protein